MYIRNEIVYEANNSWSLFTLWFLKEYKICDNSSFKLNALYYFYLFLQFNSYFQAECSLPPEFEMVKTI